MLLPAVVLAAGASSRMGQPKALLRTGDRTFVRHLLDTLHDAGLDDILVVTGLHDREIREELALPGTPLVRVVHNPHHARGQLSSLQAALAAIDHPGVEAMMVALVDQPMVRSMTVRALVEAWRATRAPVVRPRLGRRHGHPVVFDRAVFGALRAASLDTGARDVVRARGDAVVDVEVTDEGVCLDVDTPEDYARLIARSGPDAHGS